MRTPAAILKDILANSDPDYAARTSMFQLWLSNVFPDGGYFSLLMLLGWLGTIIFAGWQVLSGYQRTSLPVCATAAVLLPLALISFSLLRPLHWYAGLFDAVVTMGGDARTPFIYEFEVSFSYWAGCTITLLNLTLVIWAWRKRVRRQRFSSQSSSF